MTLYRNRATLPSMSVQLRFNPTRPQPGAPEEALLIDGNVAIQGITRSKRARLSVERLPNGFLTKPLALEPGTLTVVCQYQPLPWMQRTGHWYDVPVMIDAYIGIEGVLRNGRIRYGTYILEAYDEEASQSGREYTDSDGVEFEVFDFTMTFRQSGGSLALAGVPSPPTPGGAGIV